MPNPARERIARDPTDDPHHAIARGVLETLRRLGGGPDPRRLADFTQSLLAPEPSAFEASVTALLAEGVAREELVDRYVPAAARALGEGWVDGSLGFAVVTVGSARLQALVRELADDQDVTATGAGGAGRTALVVLPEGQAHSLGAVIAADQLRRAGISTRLVMGRSERELASILRGGRYDAVLLSVGCGTPLASIASLATSIRGAASDPVAIALGGSIATAHPGAPGADDDTRSGDAAHDLARIEALTGVDFVGGDVMAALEACGLAAFRRRAPSPCRLQGRVRSAP